MEILIAPALTATGGGGCLAATTHDLRPSLFTSRDDATCGVLQTPRTNGYIEDSLGYSFGNAL